MKLMIASDIHGSAYWCERLLAAYRREGAEKLLLLGDVLYHGPRNDLPREYAPKRVIEMLNGMKDEILCVRGNCDTEVDQMVLDFPILAPYALIPLGERMLFATHGHIHHAASLPPLKKGDIVLHGHTHIPIWEEHEGIFVLNPGSVTIPKAGSARSYMILEDGTFTWKKLEDMSAYHSLSL